MMHPYFKDSNYDVMTSEIKIIDGESKVKVYVESRNFETNKDMIVEFYVPDYQIIRNEGFSQEQLDKLFSLIKELEISIWDMADYYSNGGKLYA